MASDRTRGKSSMTAPRPIEIEVAGKLYSVTVEPISTVAGHFRVMWGENEYVINAGRLDSQTLSLIEVGKNNSSIEARIVVFGSRGDLNVTINGLSQRVRVNQGPRVVSGDNGDTLVGQNEVVAPMPGRVARLLVQVGDMVAANQSVVVVEAMKMENELSTERAGTVKQILTSEGASVDAGTVLLVVE